MPQENFHSELSKLDGDFRTYQAVQKWCDEHSMGWEWRTYFGNTFMSNRLHLSYLVGEAVKHVTFRELVPCGRCGRKIKLFTAKLKYIYALLPGSLRPVKRYEH